MEKFFFRVVHTKAKAIRTEHSKDKSDENPDLDLCNNESLSKQRRFANRSPCLTWRVTAGVPRLFEADVRQRWLGATVWCQSCWGIAIYAAPSAVCTILMLTSSRGITIPEASYYSREYWHPAKPLWQQPSARAMASIVRRPCHLTGVVRAYSCTLLCQDGVPRYYLHRAWDSVR